MDFGLTADQRKRYGDILGSARRLHRPPAVSGSHAGRGARRAAAELRLTGLCLPEEHGGGRLGAPDTALCLEAPTARRAHTRPALRIPPHPPAPRGPITT